MYTKTTYFADDGTAFESKGECLEYERKQRMSPYKDTAFLFDECGNLLPLTDEGFQKAIFIYCKDNEAAGYMFEEFSRNWRTPWGNWATTLCASSGCWMYDDERDKWIPADDILKTAEIIQKIMKK